ncbi:hypothetical protein PHYPO_G00200430 [Pangasianodon hypophthalmus]|uniref:Uncharacterized protein n=1 Tax=Pangasianodon hypophthalmus TaxID=310915 RepID=A0A5N5PBX9_PANHP|nr:hypothetical protein PHYPO_G00200430 [Pangasianodon hypophthalmus]
MMVHALKVQAEIHQVPEYQVTAEELEGISLTKMDPETEPETQSDNGPEPNQEAERCRRERQSPTRPLFKHKFPQRRFNANISNQEARPEWVRRLRVAPPLRQCCDSGFLRLAEITSGLICDLIRDYSAMFSNTCGKRFCVKDIWQDIYDNASMIQQDPLQAIENAILGLNRHDDPFLEIEAAIHSINVEEGERGPYGEEGVEGGAEGEGEGIEEEGPEGGVVGNGRELGEGGGGGVGTRADREEVQVGGGGCAMVEDEEEHGADAQEF